MGNTKWIHLTFAVAGLLAIWVISLFAEWIWGYVGKPKDSVIMPLSFILGGGLAYVGWRNERLFNRISDVLQELMRVTWPTRKETSAATVVVIVTVIVFSMILGVFDILWSWVTDTIYS